MQNITIKLPDEMLHDIDIISKKTGKTKSWIIRNGLEILLDEYRYLGIYEKPKVNWGGLPLIIPEKDL